MIDNYYQEVQKNTCDKVDKAPHHVTTVSLAGVDPGGHHHSSLLFSLCEVGGGGGYCEEVDHVTP